MLHILAGYNVPLKNALLKELMKAHSPERYSVPMSPWWGHPRDHGDGDGDGDGDGVQSPSSSSLSLSLSTAFDYVNACVA